MMQVPRSLLSHSGDAGAATRFGFVFCVAKSKQGHRMQALLLGLANNICRLVFLVHLQCIFL